jgi:transposase-like protein/very-short-patch-repair endonuclease
MSSETYAPEQKEKAIALRKQGLMLDDIAVQTGVKEGTIRSWCRELGIRLTSEQRSANVSKRIISLEQERQLIIDRKGGATRKDLARKYGLTVAAVKSVLKRNKTVLPMETRQQNAHQAKLTSNPNTMSEMREGLTPEVIVRRTASICTTYQDQGLRDLKGIQSRKWWANKIHRSKYTLDDLLATMESNRLTLLEAVAGEPRLGEQLWFECFCGTRADAYGYDLLYGKTRSCGCVKSHYEVQMANFLSKGGLQFTKTREVLGKLELDFWIPSLNVAIEINGLWAHSDSKTQKYDHLDKLERCEAKGIRLVTIFTDELNQRPHPVQNYLSAILKLNKHHIGARETTAEIIPAIEARQFLEQYHIQGSTLGTYTGLRFDGQLVAVGCWRKRYGTTYELLRYCLGNKGVVGGLGKLVAHFRALKEVGSIVTFSDRRWSQGNIYKSLGFKMTKKLGPSYWYTKGDVHRWHKSEFRKAKLGLLNQTETEREAMERLGYGRIWDCGYLRWELNF